MMSVAKNECILSNGGGINEVRGCYSGSQKGILCTLGAYIHIIATLSKWTHSRVMSRRSSHP